MEDLLDESPFPSRLVFDEHQPQEIIEDADLAVGEVLLPIDFAGQPVHFGHEMHASRLFGLVNELHRLRRAREWWRLFFADQHAAAAAASLRFGVEADVRSLAFQPGRLQARR